MERRRVLTVLAAAVPVAVITLLGSRRGTAPSDPSPTAGPTPGSAAAPPSVGPDAGDAGDARPDDADAGEHGAGVTDTAMLDVVCRDAVGLVAATTGTATHTPVRVTIHHSAVVLDAARRAPSQLRAFQRDHQQRGWVDVAYHRAIDPAGNVYELRDPTVPGDSSTPYDTTGHLQLLCLGDFDRQEPTPAMLEALGRLVAAECAARDIPLDTLSAHRDHVLTWCPGGALYARMDEVRSRAAELLASGAPTLRRVCGAEGATRVAAIESGA